MLAHLKDSLTFIKLNFHHSCYYGNPLIKVYSPIKRNFRNLSDRIYEFLKNLRHSKVRANLEWYNII